MPQDPSAFTLFPAFPPEVRHQIWAHALPEDQPSLQSYIDIDPPPQTPYIPNPKYKARLNTTGGWTLYFGPREAEILIHCKIVLFLVNYEACGIANTWLKNHAAWRRLGPRTDYTFCREYNPDSDRLYISVDELKDIARAFRQGWHPMESPTVVAVPEEAVTHHRDALAQILDLMMAETTYIIVGAILDLDSNGVVGLPIPKSCRITTVQSCKTLVWSKGQETYHWTGRRSIGSQSLHLHMEELCRLLADRFDLFKDIEGDTVQMVPVSVS